MDKIGIITANFGRLDVLNIFCAGIKRLRYDTGMNIPCVSAGDISGKSLFDKYGITFIEHPNKPLTSKFNRACLELKDKVEYVLIMGTDDLISTTAFNSVVAEAAKGTDLIGFDSIYFYGLDDIFTGKLVHFSHTTVLGVGRTVSARVLNNVYWQPWGQDRDRGIDCVMLDTVRPYVRTSTLLKNYFLVDLKSSLNLNKLHFWYKKLGALPNSNLLWSNIGQEETELIKAFINK